jgi:predicted Zn-dependent protease
MDFLEKDAEAQAALQKALAISPDNAEFLTALTQFYLKRGKYREAEPFAKRLYEAHPTHPAGREMLEFIQSRVPNEKK